MGDFPGMDDRHPSDGGITQDLYDDINNYSMFIDKKDPLLSSDEDDEHEAATAVHFGPWNTSRDYENTRREIAISLNRKESPVSTSSSEDLPKYDAFTTEIIEHTNTDSDKCYEIAKQICKVVAYIVTFLLVLGAAIISKGCLLFMTSQIRADKTTPYCYDSDQLESYQAVSNLQERAQWIWAIFFTFMVPELWTLIRCVILITFKSFNFPTLTVFLTVFFFEALHTVGIALLVFVALPELDVVKGVMLTNCTCIIPGILLMVSRIVQGDAKVDEEDAEAKKWWTKTRIGCVVFDVLAIVSQLSGLIAWPLTDSDRLQYATWAIPIGILLTSFGWWENYLNIKFKISKKDEKMKKYGLAPVDRDEETENFVTRFLRSLNAIKTCLNQKRTRSFVYVFVPVWKLAVFFGSMVGFVCLTSGETGNNRFFIFKYMLSSNGTRTVAVESTNVSMRLYESPHLDGSLSIFSVTPTESTSTTTDADPMAAIITFIIQAVAAYTCYVIGKYTCRVKIQTFSYAVPLTLTVPLTITLLMTFCGMKSADVCFAESVIPPYLYWVCPANDIFTTFLVKDQAWVWIFWFLSQVWITAHIWAPKCDRLAPTPIVFVTPMYNGILADQSLTLNRRINDGKKLKTADMFPDVEQQYPNDASSTCSLQRETEKPEATDSIPKIIGCITMWHETENEMLQTLKSSMRMDIDQCNRYLAQKYLGVVDKDYYTFEANIFMDNAFDYENMDINQPKINEYAERLIQLMNEAARKVYGDSNEEWIGPPTITNMPFGGRMVFQLPGKTKLTVHMKDKQKIRIRKRWSQVMYMYYLLGYRLWNLDMDVDRLETKAENTFILALDGDIEFKPDSVRLLVDLMKKNKKLGAACGRIHPVGSGFMAWYQMFEYAIGHWLQKATEHVIGCVLCSPGCFSLFRAQALMEPNVMRTYTTPPTKPRHYVQYEQGEDRWLCTLLLQRGFRVEYAAASDAYTHCPEAFGEFFQQRRRWVPSTMANIIDLLQTSRDTIKNNDDISIIYIFYQWFLLVSSIIGPGTIFLMLMGSIVAAFGIDIYTAMWINLVPVLLFLLVCMFAKQKYQIMLAQILTCVYALLMMAVIVGILMEANVHGWLAPSSFFLLVTAGLMIITALLHPMEMFCIICGIIYWVVIPSMYLLLIIYSIMNMHDVTWGVRENPKAAAEQAQAEQATELKKKNKGQKLINNLLGNNEEDDDAGFTLACANLFTCKVCTHPKPDDDIQKLIIRSDEHFEAIMDTIKGSRSTPFKSAFTGRRRSSHRPSSTKRPSRQMSLIKEEDPQEEEDIEEADSASDESKDGYEDPEEPGFSDSTSISSSDDVLWMKAECLKDATHKKLPDEELKFWNYILRKYLHPIDENKEEQKAMKKKLKNLRNQMAFAFFMINALFVVMLFLMQLHQDTLYIEYPDIGKVNISCIQLKSGENTEWQVDVEKDMLRLEPIGFLFLIMFAAVLIIQFIAMLFHRFGTITLILATTNITMCEKQAADEQDTFNANHGIDFIKKVQNVNVENEVHDRKSDDEVQPFWEHRRKTIHNLQVHFNGRNVKRKNTGIGLEGHFLTRFTSISGPSGAAGNWVLQRLPSRVASKAKIEVRRQSTLQGLNNDTLARTESYAHSDSESGNTETNA